MQDARGAGPGLPSPVLGRGAGGEGMQDGRGADPSLPSPVLGRGAGGEGVERALNSHAALCETGIGWAGN
jgi:hypothetical protein